MKRFALIVAGLIGIMATPALAADCTLTVENVSPTLTPYEPFAATDTVVDLELKVTNNAASKCAALLYVNPVDGRTLRGSDGVLSYRFNGRSTVSGAGPYPIELTAGEVTRVLVQMVLPKQQIVPRADYVAAMDVRVEPVEGGTATLSGTGFSVSVQVPGRVEMSISGAPSTALSTSSLAPASIELGTMSEGQIGRAYVNVWSNGPVSVSLSSQNNGKLLLDGERSAPGVAYSATFDGIPITFPTSVVRSPPLSIVGGAYPLAVKVGSLAGRYAGRYTDVITVDVRQN